VAHAEGGGVGCHGTGESPSQGTVSESGSAGLLNLAIGLVTVSLLYNLTEAVIALWLGNQADSIALLGFGLDSVIELSASALVLWHFLKQRAGDDEAQLAQRERFAQRFIGGTFIALAVYVGVQGALDLSGHHAPDKSFVGMGLATASLLIMPFLANKKLQVAKALNSPALELEAKETMCCFWLSVILLAGLGLNALLGWWWADPVGGMLMIPWMWQEGWAALRNQDCCSHDHE
jgi:divalent metal cation (Fe/Co/Zn/Cd) transporter